KLFNLSAFDQALHQCDPSSGSCLNPERPTADVLARCHQKFMDMSFGEEGRNHYVLLVTGGDPTCNTAGNGDPCGAAGDEANRLVTDVGAKTKVVAIGAELASDSCLNALAYAGGSESAQRPYYYFPQTMSDLNDTLTQIVDLIAEDACQL